jgi:hypothetical protein
LPDDLPEGRSKIRTKGAVMLERFSQRAGFRLSRTDLAVIAGSIAGGIALWQFDPWMGAMLLITIGHFFLFCNIIRMRRSFELFWAATFVANTATLIAFSHLDWKMNLALQTPFTIILVGMEMVTERYHGIGWQLINRDYTPPQ